MYLIHFRRSDGIYKLCYTLVGVATAMSRDASSLRFNLRFTNNNNNNATMHKKSSWNKMMWLTLPGL